VYKKFDRFVNILSAARVASLPTRPSTAYEVSLVTGDDTGRPSQQAKIRLFLEFVWSLVFKASSSPKLATRALNCRRLGFEAFGWHGPGRFAKLSGGRWAKIVREGTKGEWFI
jgi:hypothetical protein